MKFGDFVTLLHDAIRPMNKVGSLMGKGSFIRYLLLLNCDENANQSFLEESPDSTFSTYAKRGLSKLIAGNMLKVMEQGKFIRMIDNLEDEQQEAINQRLRMFGCEFEYDDLPQYCADVLKRFIHNSAFKDNDSDEGFLDILSKQGDEAKSRSELTQVWFNSKNVQIIHYACTYFNDPIFPARITCIAFRSISDTTTQSFSILKEAMKLHLRPKEIQDNIDLLELNMLTDFFMSIKELRSQTWLHWNMRDSKYGFEAIINRYEYLSDCQESSGNNKKPNYINFKKRLDVADCLKKIYGDDYADHPRLQNICLINNISLLEFITGEEEAKAFENGEYNKIINSTLRKVSCIHAVLQMCIEKSLKIKADIANYESLPSCSTCPFRNNN